MKQFELMMFAGALCLTACAEHPDLLGGVELSDNQISFSSSTVNGWQGINSGSRAAVTAGENGPLKMESSLGHPLYLHPIEQSGTYIYNVKDELITRSGVPLPSDGNLLHADNANAKTRGAKFTGTSLTNAFGVSAILTNNNATSSYFQNLKATPSGGSWITSDAKYWPTDGSLSFYAYYPYSTDSHGMLSEDATVDVSKARTVHYVASTTDIVNQPDLIIAKRESVTHGSTEAPNSVNLNFSHVLTAITFAVGSDMVPGTVKSIAIKGVKNTGDYDLSTGQWTTSGAGADFKINLGNNGQGIAFNGQQDLALTTGAQTLMMIPQTFNANSKAKVEIVFTPTNGQEKTLSASLAKTSWTEGSTIIYKLSTSSLQPVLTAVNTTFPNDWNNKYTAGALKAKYVRNDKMGLYVVDQTGIVKEANVELTYDGTKWNFPTGKTIRLNPMTKYFTYYPYQQSPQGMPNLNETVPLTDVASANAFFKKLEDAWSPNTDQSTMDKMNASDLQVADARINSTGNGIDLTMAHAMGLADLTLGKGPAHFKLSKGEEYKFDGTHFACNDIEGRKLYKLAKNHYVAIVSPNKQTEFKPKNAVCLPWKQSSLIFQPTIAEIQKKIADPIDNDPTIYPYTLEPGDVYYSDGACSHQDDDLEVGKIPIGIVGYIGQNKWTEYQTGSGHGGHALVANLKDFNSAFDSQNRNSTVQKDYANSIDDIKNPDAITSGYVVTKRFSQVSNGYEAFKLVNDATVNPCQAPADKSTGWFVPSIGQWYAFFIGLGGLNPDGWSLGAETRYNNQHTAEPEIQKKLDSIFRKAGKDYSFINVQGWGPVEWAASDSPYLSFAFCADFSLGYFTLAGNGTKYYILHVRPFLAF